LRNLLSPSPHPASPAALLTKLTTRVIFTIVRHLRECKAQAKDETMAITWLKALKVIPWGEVLEHAPSVLNAARKLMDRHPPQPPEPAGAPDTTNPMSAVPSLGELKNALIAAQGQIDRQAHTQRELTETLAELAEQNARLVSTVEVLRVRTRVLVWGGAVLLVWLVVLTW